MTLKFKTEKSADVGRLIAGLGRVGRQMAALPEKAEGNAYQYSTCDVGPRLKYNTALEDVAMDDAPAAGGADSKEQTAPEANKPTPNAAGGGGGGKKKKKGKK